MSLDGGEEPHWSANGKRLYYRVDTTLMEVDVEAGATFRSGTPRVLIRGVPNFRVESGIETLHWAGPKLKGLLRVLAVAGFMHVIAIGVYDVPVNIAGLYAGPTDTYPSYLRTQYCGPDTPRRCPDGTLFDDR